MDPTIIIPIMQPAPTSKSHSTDSPTHTLSWQLLPRCLMACLSVKSQPVCCYRAELSDDLQPDQLGQYFDTLDDIYAYVCSQDNVQVDPGYKFITITTKGPTKKYQSVPIARLPLTRDTMQGDGEGRQAEGTGMESDEWMDTLANDIIEIIENKSKNRISLQDDYVRRSELDEIVEGLRGYVRQQLQGVQAQGGSSSQMREGIDSEQIGEVQEAMRVFSSRIEQMQYQVQTIKSTLSSLEQTWSQTYRIHRQQFMSQVHKLECSLTHNRTLHPTKQQTDTIINKMLQLGARLQQLQHSSTTPQLRDQLQSKFRCQEQKITELQQKIVLGGQKIEGKQTVKLQTQLSPFPAIEWVDNRCIHYGRVAVEGSTIRLTSIGGAHLFGRLPIKDKNTFSVHLLSGSGKLGLGVIDAEYRDQLLFGQQLSRVSYRHDRKFTSLQVQKYDQGHGFKLGEVVTVEVDLELGTILWRTGNYLRHSWHADQLRNRKIPWVPYIHLFQKDDQVQIYD